MTDINLNNLYAIGSGSYLQASNLSNVLDSAKQFQNIIQSEINQYDTQNKLVSEAALAKQRQITITDSTRKRTQAYSNMMIVVCIFLGIMLLLAFLKPMMEFIPGIMFDLLIGLLGGGAVIYVLVTVRAIQARDVSDYDRLNLPAPSPSTMISSANSGSNDLISATFVPPCVGAACCGDGMIYDRDRAVCVPEGSGSGSGSGSGAVQGMTTMENAVNDGWSNKGLGQMFGDGVVQPYNHDGPKMVF